MLKQQENTDQTHFYCSQAKMKLCILALFAILAITAAAPFGSKEITDDVPVPTIAVSNEAGETGTSGVAEDDNPGASAGDGTFDNSVGAGDDGLSGMIKQPHHYLLLFIMYTHSVIIPFAKGN